MEYKEIFESDLFKRTLERLPEKDREQALKDLKQFADMFYNKVIKPIENQ